MQDSLPFPGIWQPPLQAKRPVRLHKLRVLLLLVSRAFQNARKGHTVLKLGVCRLDLLVPLDRL
jgi:hypothetical protein